MLYGCRGSTVVKRIIARLKESHPKPHPIIFSAQFFLFVLEKTGLYPINRLNNFILLLKGLRSEDLFSFFLRNYYYFITITNYFY